MLMSWSYTNYLLCCIRIDFNAENLIFRKRCPTSSQTSGYLFLFAFY